MPAGKRASALKIALERKHMLENIAEKTADARSRLNDADYALESARLAKSQVIQQAGTQMLSQANQLTQLVLDLLR